MTLKLNGTNSEAAPAYAGDDADTGLQCGTNELKLVTGGTAQATVDSSGRLLVGETSTSVGSTMVLSGRSDNATGGSRLYMSTATTSPANNSQLGGIYFSDDSENTGAVIEVQRDGGTWTSGSSHPSRLLFGTTANGASSPTERLRITSAGAIKLASGCPGIDFSGIQTNASGMSSETLDSYEEGTWTPTLKFGSGNTGMTFEYSPSGNYTKIGNTVRIRFGFRLSAKGSSTGAITIGNLPFSGTNSAYNHPASALMALDTANDKTAVAILTGGTNLNLRIRTDANIAATNAYFGNSTSVFGTFVYDI